MSNLVDAIKNLFIGLFTTGKHLPRGRVTLQYPTERWTMPERSRGIVVLLSDQETGELNCTVCLLCERACPTGAIKINSEKDEKNKRQLVDFVVDNSLCCFCGLCEESCNFAAIKMATKYEFSTVDKSDLIWHTEKLQEMGRDVPYEKPVRKRAAAAKPAPKPAAKADDKTASETAKPEAPASNDPAPESKTEVKDSGIDTPEKKSDGEVNGKPDSKEAEGDK